jgi:hypothetical protein
LIFVVIFYTVNSVHERVSSFHVYRLSS